MGPQSSFHGAKGSPQLEGFTVSLLSPRKDKGWAQTWLNSFLSGFKQWQPLGQPFPQSFFMPAWPCDQPDTRKGRLLSQGCGVEGQSRWSADRKTFRINEKHLPDLSGCRPPSCAVGNFGNHMTLCLLGIHLSWLGVEDQWWQDSFQSWL